MSTAPTLATTFPFTHYQIHAINEDAAPVPSIAATFLPVNGHTCLFAIKSMHPITCLVYNIYLYTEDEVLFESFVHEFKRPMVINNHRLMVRGAGMVIRHNMMVTRGVEDAFPQARRLSNAAKRLPIWQFSDDI